MSNIELARISFLLLPCAWIHFAAFVSVVSWSFPVSGCKVITFIPYYQTILKKSLLKIVNEQTGRFSCALWCARRLVQICHKHSVLYMYVRTRVRMCVHFGANESGAKIVSKNFPKKVAKNFGGKKISTYLCTIEQ